MKNSIWPEVVGVLAVMTFGAVMVRGWPDLRGDGWAVASAIGTIAAAAVAGFFGTAALRDANRSRRAAGQTITAFVLPDVQHVYIKCCELLSLAQKVSCMPCAPDQETTARILDLSRDLSMPAVERCFDRLDVLGEARSMALGEALGRTTRIQRNAEHRQQCALQNHVDSCILTAGFIQTEAGKLGKLMCRVDDLPDIFDAVADLGEWRKMRPA